MPVSERVRDALAVEGELVLAGRSLDAKSLRSFYELRQHVPVWTGQEAPLAKADFLAVLRQAAEHGLEPEDYHFSAIASRQAGSVRETVELELLLSDAFFRYASHMRQGRVNMAAIEDDWLMPPTPFDAVDTLAGVGGAGAFRELLAALPPPHPDYAHLVKALAVWQSKLSGPAWPSVLPGPAIKPGMSDSRLPGIRRRLVAEGDLPADKAEGEALDPDVVAALKVFQARYGMEADGVVGHRTVLAMNTSIATRVEQIKANLERLRAMPRDLPATAIHVNVAATQAELIDKGELVFTARVIVGTPANPTPVLASQFRSLMLNPSWTVPYSISSKELLPKLQRDPLYLAKNNMIILNREEDPQGLQLDWSRYNRGYFPFVLRQLPGPATALGDVVFEMPNRFDVYLHDTPDRRLFAHGDRYFSHGCVRLQNPRVLAALLLRNNPAWTPESIDQAIATGVSRRVILSQTMPIFLTYQTVYMAREGGLQFRSDIYGRDWRLNLALARLREGTLPAESVMLVAAVKDAESGQGVPKKQAGN